MAWQPQRIHSKAAERWRGRRYVHFHPSLASAAALREHQTLGPRRSARDHAVAKEEPNQCEISKDGDLPGKKARECMHRGGRRSSSTRQHSHKIKISRLNQEVLLLIDTWCHGKVLIVVKLFRKSSYCSSFQIDFLNF